MTQIKIQSEPSISRASLKKYSSIVVLVDENTRHFCYEKIRNQLPPHQLIEVPGGEEHKNLSTCQFIWQRLTDYLTDRHSILIIVGGGVLGDMGGFCAATFKRGIDFLLMPTTLLAQVDASVGGKLGVDFGQFKNHLGVFQNPVSIQIATQYLSTLPLPELRSGFAEVIKHCLIADKKMWGVISRLPLQEQDWQNLVKHSVKIKSSVVRKDPREKGLRKILNFGHTVGHAIEGHFLTSGAKVLHGEAIAAGMVMESHLALRKKLLAAKDQHSIAQYIVSIFGKIVLDTDDKWLSLLKHDKKNKGGKVLMALPKGIGKAVWDVPVTEPEILASLDYYRGFQT